MIERVFAHIFHKTRESKKLCKKRVLGKFGTIKNMEEYKFYLGKMQGIAECEELIQKTYTELFGSAIKQTGEVVNVK